MATRFDQVPLISNKSDSDYFPRNSLHDPGEDVHDIFIREHLWRQSRCYRLVGLLASVLLVLFAAGTIGYYFFIQQTQTGSTQHMPVADLPKVQAGVGGTKENIIVEVTNNFSHDVEKNPGLENGESLDMKELTVSDNDDFDNVQLNKNGYSNLQESNGSIAEGKIQPIESDIETELDIDQVGDEVVVTTVNVEEIKEYYESELDFEEIREDKVETEIDIEQFQHGIVTTVNVEVLPDDNTETKVGLEQFREDHSYIKTEVDPEQIQDKYFENEAAEINPVETEDWLVADSNEMRNSEESKEMVDGQMPRHEEQSYYQYQYRVTDQKVKDTSSDTNIDMSSSMEDGYDTDLVDVTNTDTGRHLSSSMEDVYDTDLVDVSNTDTGRHLSSSMEDREQTYSKERLNEDTVNSYEYKDLYGNYKYGRVSPKEDIAGKNKDEKDVWSRLYDIDNDENDDVYDDEESDDFQYRSYIESE